VTDLTPHDTVYALAAGSDHLYAARLSGLYRSSDGGHTWQDALTSLERPEPLAVTAVATDGGTTVFAGTNGAVLRSDDAGASWEIAGLSSPPPNVAALALSPNYREDDLIAAGTAEDGVFVSADRGVTWIPWNFGLVDLHVYALAISPDFSADRTIFAGTESGIFRSPNSGRAWREVAFPMDAAPVLSLGMAPAYAADGLMYAGTEKKGLFVSDDFGLNWRQAKHDLLSTAAVNAIQIAASRTWLLLEDRLIGSSDQGHSWKPDHRPIPSGKMAMTMLVHPAAPDRVLVGFADGDILRLD
jgi:photosystem II stability/assembly factor-like uncharacterized protein